MKKEKDKKNKNEININLDFIMLIMIFVCVIFMCNSFKMLAEKERKPVQEKYVPPIEKGVVIYYQIPYYYYYESNDISKKDINKTLELLSESANSICENSKVYRDKNGYFVVELPNYDYNSAEEKPRVIEKFESPIRIEYVETIVVK